MTDCICNDDVMFHDPACPMASHNLQTLVAKRKTTEQTCDHLWAYQGLIHWLHGDRPGSGAEYRWYADRYYCQRCLETTDRNARVSGNSYTKPIEGSKPK